MVTTSTHKIEITPGIFVAGISFILLGTAFGGYGNMSFKIYHVGVAQGNRSYQRLGIVIGCWISQTICLYFAMNWLPLTVYLSFLNVGLANQIIWAYVLLGETVNKWQVLCLIVLTSSCVGTALTFGDKSNTSTFDIVKNNMNSFGAIFWLLIATPILLVCMGAVYKTIYSLLLTNPSTQSRARNTSDVSLPDDDINASDSSSNTSDPALPIPNDPMSLLRLSMTNFFESLPKYRARSISQHGYFGFFSVLFASVFVVGFLRGSNLVLCKILVDGSMDVMKGLEIDAGWWMILPIILSLCCVGFGFIFYGWGFQLYEAVILTVCNQAMQALIGLMSSMIFLKEKPDHPVLFLSAFIGIILSALLFAYLNEQNEPVPVGQNVSNVSEKTTGRLKSC